jgi:DNA-binding PadR family transcriptional regulator
LFSAKQEPANLLDQVGRADLPYHHVFIGKVRWCPTPTLQTQPCLELTSAKEARAENVSFGWWRPSPSSIYPLLEDMNRDELIKKRDDGKYEITDKGRDEIHWFHGPWTHTPRPASVEEMLNEIEAYLSYFEDLANSNKPKIEAHSNRIKTIKDRITKLADTVQGRQTAT